MSPAFALDETILDQLAEKHSWKIDITDNSNFMVSYKKSDMRLNFWLTTGTVGSYLYHPKKKLKTQLFRRCVTMDEVEEIFVNPRIHTGKGYHETKEYLPMDDLQRKRSRQEDDEEYNEELDERPSKRSRISCQFGVHCEREGCMYEHRCRYGTECTREDCFYDHSDGDSAWWYNELCRYGTECSRGDCKFLHPYGKREHVRCKYGDYCLREDCWYEH